MNIVIVGAGSIGGYIAGLLSTQENNVVLVDCVEQRLEKVGHDLDVMLRLGSGTDWQLLDDLLELRPDMILALTDNDQTNLVCCAMAKNLGYPQTIARVHDEGYFNRTRLDFERIFSVDHLVGPELLVAQDLFKAIVAPGSVSVESFSHGAVQMRTVVVPERWRDVGKPLHTLKFPDGIMVGLIRRIYGTSKKGKQVLKTIFPHGDDELQAGDQVTFLGETDVVRDIPRLFGNSERTVKNVMIAGGTLIARTLVRLLEREGIEVKLIDKDHALCGRLAQELPRTTVIHHDATDVEFLIGERAGASDVFVSCLRRDESNLLSSLVAREAGCPRVVSLVSDQRYIPMIQQLDVAHPVSARASTANRILSLVRSQAVTSMVSLHEGQAEILEVNVSLDSKFAGIPIAELGPDLPEDFLICVIQNRGRIMVANGRRILSPGDTMIVITSPTHVKEFEKIF